MKPKVLSTGAKKAFCIGLMCSLAYLSVYLAKNILSAAAPQITTDGAFTTVQIGVMSSAYFVAYAVGQLINGAIGDYIKGKHMIAFGLLFSSVAFWLLPLLAGRPGSAVLAYTVSGFFMAMIYGPMTKLVAENTEPIYAPRCSLGYSLASFLGSPLAGVLAASMPWKAAFQTSAGALVAMGAVCFFAFTLLEQKGIIKYGQYKHSAKTEGGGVRLLIKRRIVHFAGIAILTGVVRTTVLFWLPTYLSAYLEFSEETAALLFTVASLGLSLTPFVSLFIYERLNRNIDLINLLGFGLSCCGFLAAFIVRQPVVNVCCVVLAIFGANCASNLLWAVYCPSLYDTGMVSGATGFLDCCSYFSAAVSSTVFANAANTIGWKWLIFVWFSLMICGVMICLPRKMKTTERS